MKGPTDENDALNNTSRRCPLRHKNYTRTRIPSLKEPSKVPRHGVLIVTHQSVLRSAQAQDLWIGNSVQFRCNRTLEINGRSPTHTPRRMALRRSLSA